MDEAENKVLTAITPGTQMGALLRRHWMPIAGEAEFDDVTVKAIRLLGEDLVLYRDLSGAFGLVARKCAHRRADLSYGFVEKCGLRCNYHGWAYDETGQCIEQPYEDTVAPKLRYKEKIRITAYPVRAQAGMLWTYMGPLPAPILPNWEPFTWPNGFRQIIISEIPCNWLQCQENSIDPVHFEWMHTNWTRRLEDPLAEHGPRNLKIEFDEFEYGLIYRRLREDLSDQHTMWTIGRVCLWPNCFFLGDHFEWRIPIDDENTLSIAWTFNRVPPDREPFVQEKIPVWHGPIREPETGRWISTHVMNQDFVAWIGQGTIADRSQEKLGLSDRGIMMLRRRLLADLATIARGEDPSGIIREGDPAAPVPLPVADRDILTKGLSLAGLKAHPVFRDHLERFIFQAGQPPQIWADFQHAMGLAAV